MRGLHAERVTAVHRFFAGGTVARGTSTSAETLGAIYVKKSKSGDHSLISSDALRKTNLYKKVAREHSVATAGENEDTNGALVTIGHAIAK